MHYLHYLRLILAPGAAVLFIALVRRFPWLGWAMLAFVLVSAYDYSGLTVVANFGSTAIYPADVIAVVLLGSIFLTPGALTKIAPVELWIWVPVVLVACMSLMRGVHEFGLNVAANEARSIFQLIAATLWVWGRMRLPGFEKSFRRWTILTGVALAADALYHIKLRGIGQVDQLITVNGQLVTSRPLVSGQALAIGLIGLCLLVRERRWSLRLLGVGFLGLAFLCQHRSVWVSMVTALVMLVLVSRVRGRILALGFVVGVALTIVYATGALDPLLTKLHLALTSHGTAQDRVLGDRTLVNEQDKLGWFIKLFGQPFGGGYIRYSTDGTIESFAPHNYFVLLYLRTGAIGAGLFLVAMLRGLRNSLVLRDPRGVAFAAGILTYCLAYNLPMLIAPFLAVALTTHVRTGDRAAQHPSASSPDDVPVPAGVA